MDGQLDPEAVLGPLAGQVERYLPAKREAETLDTRLRLFTLADCATAKPEGYLVKGVIAPGNLVVLFGPPGAGKSLIAPLIAHAIASGRGVFGRRVRRGRVLYMAAEDGTGMRQRARALLEAIGPADGFFIAPGPVDLLLENDDVPTDFDALRAAARRLRIALIVIDTMAAAFPGLDENDGRAMGSAVQRLRQLAEGGAAVLIVHHGAKGGGSTPRGHGVLDGAADVTLRIDVPENRTAPRTNKFGKNRNGSSAGTFSFTIGEIDLGRDEDGDLVTAPLAVEAVEDAAAGSGRAKARKTLSDDQVLLLRELHNLAATAESRAPLPGMPPVQAVSRSQLWKRLVDVGWFEDHELRQTVPGTGNAKHPITRKAQTRATKALNALKVKGLAASSEDMVWPL